MDIILPCGYDAYANELLDLTDDTAQTLTTTNLVDGNNRPVRAIVVTVTGQAATFTVDGTTPTNAAGTNVGLHVPANSSIVVYGKPNIENFSILNTTAGSDAIVDVQFFS